MRLPCPGYIRQSAPTSWVIHTTTGCQLVSLRWRCLDHTEDKPSPTQQHVQLLSLLENCSCSSSALQSTLSHGSQDPSMCLSVRKVGFLCALVVLLKQSIYPYQKSVSSDAHKAKNSCIKLKGKAMSLLNCITLTSLYMKLAFAHPLPHASSNPKVVSIYTFPKLQDN